MSKRTSLAIVLAAGEGTRMRSTLPKVLHPIAGRSMLAHVLAAVRGAGTEAVAIVVGPKAEAGAEVARRALPKEQVLVHKDRLGTAPTGTAGRTGIGQD